MIVLIVAGVVLGPRADLDERWVEPDLPGDETAPASLTRYLAEAEGAVPRVRPGDERQIVWADPTAPGRTSVALVYLHGFSADRHEIEPVVSRLGRALDANVYFARLRGHGRDGAAMSEATAADWLDDTVEAVAIGNRIGDHVVLIGTSTGGTLATWAAARPESEGRIRAVALVSPNFHPKDRSSRVLLYPWGGALARIIVGTERCFTPENEVQQRHWTTCYPTSALLPMMALVERVRTTDLSTLRVPVLLVYSPRDQVVDATETERVLERLPAGLVRTHVVEGSGDPARHVLAGDILSPETTAQLEGVLESFVRDVVPDSNSNMN